MSDKCITFTIKKDGVWGKSPPVEESKMVCGERNIDELKAKIKSEMDEWTRETNEHGQYKATIPDMFWGMYRIFEELDDSSPRSQLTVHFMEQDPDDYVDNQFLKVSGLGVRDDRQFDPWEFEPYPFEMRPQSD